MVSQGLEGFVELVTAFAGQQRDLVAALQEIVPTLQQNLDAIPEALSALNPETHSLGWIFALHTSLAAASDMNQGPGSPPDQARPTAP